MAGNPDGACGVPEVWGTPEGVLVGGVVAAGVVTDGVETGVPGTVTEGTVTEGALTDGTVTDGVVGVDNAAAWSEGVNSDSTPRMTGMTRTPLLNARVPI